jgi:hypothetical protein
MKPWRIILSIVLCLIAIIRLASTCAKNAADEKTNKFSKEFAEIEGRWRKVFRYDKNDADSLQWKLDHLKLFTQALDSGTRYYRDNYYQDEARYKGYLLLLYEFKKLYYLCLDWFKYQKDNINAKEHKKEYDNKANAFYLDMQGALFEMRKKGIMSQFGY